MVISGIYYMELVQRAAPIGKIGGDGRMIQDALIVFAFYKHYLCKCRVKVASELVNVFIHCGSVGCFLFRETIFSE